MRRWNGWGDDTIDLPLNDETLSFLRERIGPSAAPRDATFDEIRRTIPPSRLERRGFIDTTPQARLLNGLGQSVPDWLKLRYGKIGTLPDAVAFPENTEQVHELLRSAVHDNVTVIPYGGGTSVVGHLTAQPGNRRVLTINMSRMSRFIDFDRQAQLATFGAGVAGPDLEAQLRAHGYTLGHFPQSFEYSTLGGWVATRSSGQQSMRYGRIEQLFAGGHLETPVGSLDIGTFPASAAGIDLREIVLGSEGRLGILTQATVRVSLLAPREEFHAVFFPDWEHAESAVRAITQARLPLSMLRLSNDVETVTTLTLAGDKKLVGWLQRYLGLRGSRDKKCMLLIGASGDAATLAHGLRGALRIARSQHGIHTGRAIGNKWKHNRFRNVYLRNTLWRHGYVIDTAETAVDWPRVTTMMRAVEQAATDALAACGERVHTYSHLSHVYTQGASVYTTFAYRLAGDFEEDFTRWSRLKAAVSRAIVANGGTISHQHGVGTDHAPYLEAEKGALGIGAMRELIRYFDPDGVMNPGKLLP